MESQQNLKGLKGELVNWLGKLGFIKHEGRNIFFHHSNFYGTPVVGQVVRFDFALAPNPNRPPMAVNIKIVKSASVTFREKQLREALTKAQTVSSGVKALGGGAV